MHPYVLEKLAVATIQELEREAVAFEKAARVRDLSRLEAHRAERRAARELARRVEPSIATE